MFEWSGVSDKKLAGKKSDEFLRLSDKNDPSPTADEDDVDEAKEMFESSEIDDPKKIEFCRTLFVEQTRLFAEEKLESSDSSMAL